MDAIPPRSLAYRALFRVPDAGGLRIVCTAGCLWVTVDGDPRDILLEAGESFEADGHAPALLYAMEASAFLLAPRLQGSSRRNAAKNSSDCKRSPWHWAATRAASSGATGCSGRPVDSASTCAWQARSR
jgi:hypothetical protein